MRSRLLAAVLVFALFGAVASVSSPASAVQASHAGLVSTNPADYTPFIQPNDTDVPTHQVLAVAQVGTRIIAGGNFTQAKNYQGNQPLVTRNKILAFDAATGQLDDGFVPVIDGDVLALAPAPDGTSVFVGGKFQNVNGVAARGIAKLDVATGALVPGFNMTTNAWVQDLKVRGNRLFLSGTFSTMKATPRTGFGAVDATTGSIDPSVAPVFSDTVDGFALLIPKFDITPDGTRAVVTGSFSRVDGLPRRFLVMLDLTTTPTSVAPWNQQRTLGACSVINYLRAVDISPSGQYFVLTTTGAFRGGPPSLCDTASRWEINKTSDAVEPTWVEYTGGDSLFSVAVTDAVVYLGGHQRWQNNSNPPRAGAGPGYVNRPGISAVDPQTGVVFSWNPTRTRGYGVTAMLATPDGLWIGDDTEIVGGEFHPRIAFFPLAGGAAVPSIAPATLPTTLYRATANGELNARSFNGSTTGSPSLTDKALGWAQVRGAFMTNGRVYTGQADGSFQVRTFDGTSFGPATNLNSWISFADVTGMFLRNGRLYFTRAGDPKLYYRFFNTESNVIGSVLYTASGDGDGLNWSATKGMTSAGDKLFAAFSDGTFRRYAMAINGRPVAASATVIGGPAVDSTDWSSTALFTLHRAPSPK